MNRLLQHFVDSNGAPRAPASRPPIPVPPQSSGGSYHGGNHGSYQRAASGGPFYYQPSHAQPHWQPPSASGLEEISLTSQSSGGTYETVDLNTDTSQQQQLFAPNRGSSFESKESAAELFSSDPPPAKELFDSGDNMYRRQSKSVTNSPFVNGYGKNNMTSSSFGTSGEGRFGYYPSQKDSFSNPDNGGTTSVVKNPFTTQNGQKDPFAAHTENLFGNGTQGAENNVKDSFTAQPPKETEYRHDQQRQQQSPSSTADPFASAHSHMDTSPFELSTSMNDGHEYMPSADSLFGSPAPTNNGDWTNPAPFAQPSQPNLVQAQELFPSKEPSASSLFGADASTTFQARHRTLTDPQTNASPLPPKPPVGVSPSPVRSQVGALPSPAKLQTNSSSSPMKPPVGHPFSPMNNASSLPMRPRVASSPSPVVRSEDHLPSAFGSMKLSMPAKSPPKSGLDVRHMNFSAGKRDDDAMSNAPSITPSRMSMRSTLDDSLKLSDMYKQMTARLEGEKHDLLKVVASQAQEIAHMQKYIKSLELQLKKYQAQDV